MYKFYDEQAAINHVKKLAFTRQAGTNGESKGINYILNELEKANIVPIIEPFKWTKTFTIIIKLVFSFIILFLIICQVILFFPNLTWIILPLDVLFFIIVYSGIKILFDNTKILYIGKKRESKNVLTKVMAKDLYPKRPVIIFSAHHDTTSLRYSMKAIKFILSLGFIFLLSYLTLSLTLSVWSLITLFEITQIDYIYLLLRNISFIIGVLSLIVNIIILTNKDLDKSVGSIDNASGIAILIELAKLVKKNPLEKTDVIFFWCGAEEKAYWGSKQYCNRHFEVLNHDYDLERSYNINIDMVGTYLGLIDKTGLFKKRKLNENLNNILEASANQIKFPLKKESMFFIFGSDHITFRAFAKKFKITKFQVTSFISNKDTKFIHSKKDTPEKCNATNLNACIEICYNAIKSLDLRVDLAYK